MTKRKTLKNKTQLRKLLKDSIRNTGSLDAIEFYSDWSWDVMDVNTWTTSHVCRCRIYHMLTEWEWTGSIDSNISISFQKIEDYIGRYLSGETDQEFDLFI